MDGKDPKSGILVGLWTCNMMQDVWNTYLVINVGVLLASGFAEDLSLAWSDPYPGNHSSKSYRSEPDEIPDQFSPGGILCATSIPNSGSMTVRFPRLWHLLMMFLILKLGFDASCFP